MNTSQTRPKAPVPEVTRGDLDRLGATLQQEIQARDIGLPFGQYEFVDVTFNSTANGDTEIKHSLVGSDPEAIRAVAIEWQFTTTPVESPYIWRNIASTRRPWGTGYIILKCNLASARARLLLFTEAQ